MDTTPAVTYVGIDVAAKTLAVVVLAPRGGRRPGRHGGQRRRRLAGADGPPAGRRPRPGRDPADHGGDRQLLGRGGHRPDGRRLGGVRRQPGQRARLRPGDDAAGQTDAVDAGGAGRLRARPDAARLEPPPPEVRALQLLVRQRDDLVQLQTATRNRQHALAQLPAGPAEVAAPAERQVLAVLAEQIAGSRRSSSGGRARRPSSRRTSPGWRRSRGSGR